MFILNQAFNVCVVCQYDSFLLIEIVTEYKNNLLEPPNAGEIWGKKQGVKKKYDEHIMWNYLLRT